MSREVRRTPVGFEWPIGEVWAGYLMPEYLHLDACRHCKNGYGPEAQVFYDQWYGNAPFDPRSTGSEPFLPSGEDAQDWAKRQCERTPEYYGTGQVAIDREALRITEYWNESWSHHLSQEDVDALLAADRLWDLTRKFVRGEGWVTPEVPIHPTAAEVNRWSLNGFGHDGSNAWTCVSARAEREGVELECKSCGGTGRAEVFEGQRDLASHWKAQEHPTGEGWQLWGTVSEGNPESPSFATAEELAVHIVANPSIMGPGGAPSTVEQALAWVTGPGWAPSGVFIMSEEES